MGEEYIPQLESKKSVDENIFREDPSNDLMRHFWKALEKKEGKNSLHQLGNLLYQTFQNESPEIVLSSLKEVYEEHEKPLQMKDHKMDFVRFIQAFGEGLVILVQEKLSTAGYDLGTFGPAGNGIDGKLGSRTKYALYDYFGEKQELIQQDTELQTADKKRSNNSSEASVLEGAPEIVSPKEELEAQIKEIYLQDQTDFTAQNQRYYFANDEKAHLSWNQLETKFKRFIIEKDPIKGSNSITFLGRQITGGVNAYMLPLLMAAEHEIEEQGINYRPHGKTIGGAKFRGMMIHGVESREFLSAHAGGLPIDIDASSNGAHYDGGADNRGDIPDAVVLTLVKYGFAWGGVGGKGFEELGDDPMHFQLRFHPDSPAYQAILNTNSVARRYYEAIVSQYRPLPELQRKDIA